MLAYVVLSDSIIHGNQSHGLHGVYKSKDDAKRTAMSTIASIASKQKVIIGPCDIQYENDGMELSFCNNSIDIYVSCIEQEIQ